MERRRTYSPGSKKNRGRKIVTILAIVFGLILVFYISFIASSHLLGGSDEVPTDLEGLTPEEKIEELEKQVKEKDEEITMLKERLQRLETSAVTATQTPPPTTAPPATSTPTARPTERPTAAPTQTPQRTETPATQAPLPPATQQPPATLMPQLPDAPVSENQVIGD